MSSWEESRRRVGAQYEEMERKRRLGEQYKHENDWMKQKSSSSSSSSSRSSGGGYSSGPSTSPIPTSRVIAIFLALALIVVGVIVFTNYNRYYNGDWTRAVADKEASRSAQEYQAYLLSRENEFTRWYITYESAPTTIWNYLLGFAKLDKATGYTVGGYRVEDGDVLEFRFEGDDAGTGIPDGRYTLTTLDGTKVLIDKDNKTIYKEGSEFYDAYAPKLLELTYDNLLGAIFEKTEGGEHALYNADGTWMEFIRKDNTTVYSYIPSDAATRLLGGEIHAITTYPKEKMDERWSFSYENAEYVPEDWEGFVYADDNAFSADDELDKLIEKSFDGSGGVGFFKNGEVVLDIYVRYLANGYDFEIDGVAEGYGMGLEEDMVYRVNTTDKTLTKITNEGYSDEAQEDLPLSEYQDTYDFLLSIVPHTYICSLIDMDQAEVRKESAGLVTVYEMKDENGNVTADMKIMFGVIGEVIHYIAEDEYVMIELEY